jgi:hypothetical protein
VAISFGRAKCAAMQRGRNGCAYMWAVDQLSSGHELNGRAVALRPRIRRAIPRGLAAVASHLLRRSIPTLSRTVGCHREVHGR